MGKLGNKLKEVMDAKGFSMQDLAVELSKKMLQPISQEVLQILSSNYPDDLPPYLMNRLEQICEVLNYPVYGLLFSAINPSKINPDKVKNYEAIKPELEAIIKMVFLDEDDDQANETTTEENFFETLKIGDKLMTRKSLHWIEVEVKVKVDDTISCEDEEGMVHEGTKEEVNGGDYWTACWQRNDV